MIVRKILAYARCSLNGDEGRALLAAYTRDPRASKTVPSIRRKLRETDHKLHTLQHELASDGEEVAIECICRFR